MSDLIFNERAQNCLTQYAETQDPAHLIRAMRLCHVALETYHPDVKYQGVLCDNCGAQAYGITLLETDTGEIFCGESCLRASHCEDDFSEEAPE